MTPEDDDVYLSCYRISALPRPHVEAIKGRCSRCDAEVWVAFSSFSIIRDKGAKIACNECTAEAIKAGEVEEFGAPTAEQLRDIARTLANRDGKNN